MFPGHLQTTNSDGFGSPRSVIHLTPSFCIEGTPLTDGLRLHPKSDDGYTMDQHVNGNGQQLLQRPPPPATMAFPTTSISDAYDVVVYSIVCSSKYIVVNQSTAYIQLPSTCEDKLSANT